MRAVELSTLVMSSSLGLHKSGHIRVVIGMLQHRTYLVGMVWYSVAQSPGLEKLGRHGAICWLKK